MSAANDEDRQFAPVDMEFSDGGVRNRGHSFFGGTQVQIVVGCVVAIYLLAVAILLGRVNNGIQRIAESNTRAERRIADIVQPKDKDIEFKIVSWCPCGRTLPAETLQSDYDNTVALPTESATCSGCFDKWAPDVRNTWPKTDYNPTEGPSVRSFTYQMLQHGLTEETIVTKCGWHKEGSAYYAYEQEEINVRMCVIEEFLDHMVEQGWTIWSSTWLYQSKDHLAFLREKP